MDEFKLNYACRYLDELVLKEGSAFTCSNDIYDVG
jgi:hypothetical protein